MAGIRPTIIAMIVLGGFAWALISFGTLFPAINGSNQTLISSGSALSNATNAINESLQSMYGSATNQSNAFDNAQPDSGFSFIILSPILGAVSAFKTIGIGMFNIIISLISSIFGYSFSVIFGMISTIIVITLLFLAYKLYKSGESDR